MVGGVTVVASRNCLGNMLTLVHAEDDNDGNREEEV